jgi:hypothetical protein
MMEAAAVILVWESFWNERAWNIWWFGDTRIQLPGLLIDSLTFLVWISQREYRASTPVRPTVNDL